MSHLTNDVSVIDPSYSDLKPPIEPSTISISGLEFHLLISILLLIF